MERNFQEVVRKKVKAESSAREIMASVFWDAQGIVLIWYMPKGTTITAVKYQETLSDLLFAFARRDRYCVMKACCSFITVLGRGKNGITREVQMSD